MKLLKYENYQVTPSEELFLIKPMRQLYNEDRSKTKEKFMQQMSYIYFMFDPRSPYMDIVDEDSRRDAVCEQEGLEKGFKPSENLKKAIDIYKELTTTTSMKLLESMRVAIGKISEFLRKVDLYAVDEKGRPTYTVDKIVSASDKIPQLAKRLQETEKLVANEITEKSRVRGGDDARHVFEDGFKFE